MGPILTLLSMIALWASSFMSFRGGHAWLGVLLALLSIVPLLAIFGIVLFLAAWSANASGKPTESEIRSREKKIKIAAVISGVIAIALGAMSFKSFKSGNIGTGTALVVADAIPVAFTTMVVLGQTN